MAREAARATSVLLRLLQHIWKLVEADPMCLITWWVLYTGFLDVIPMILEEAIMAHSHNKVTFAAILL